MRTLERIGCAAVLIDRRGYVMRANDAAEKLFCSDFGIRHGKLWTASSVSLLRMNRFLREMECARAAGRQLPAPIVVARTEKPWLLIETMPVSSSSIEVFDGSWAVLVITDLTRSGYTDTALLELVFGLTPAESRLAAALSAGQALDAFALTSGVSKLTVRSQLKAVFAKTGARRQAELVARLGQVRSICPH
jgi:DNA-binding CsgD family transcriptional regulator